MIGEEGETILDQVGQIEYNIIEGLGGLHLMVIRDNIDDHEEALDHGD